MTLLEKHNAQMASISRLPKPEKPVGREWLASVIKNGATRRET
jgi:hypothetical protein